MDPTFIQTIKNTFGDEGEAWLSALPDLIAEASHRWNLTDIQPVSNLSYNYVAFANQTMNREVAKDAKESFKESSRLSFLSAPNGYRGENSVTLKLGVPNRELTSEIAALRFYNGHGACRLLNEDTEKGMLLLERLRPGRMLSTLKDDEQATRIAAEVMKKLWRSSNDFSRFMATKVATTANTDFIYLKDWLKGFRRLRQCYDGNTGPLPKRLIETAEFLSKELLTENKDEVLLHGDFHHFNVLESKRGWLAIDPKGVVGPKGYEVGPLLINPVPDFLSGSNPKTQTERRVAILSEILGMEPERIRSWAICHAVLSAWWSIEDNDPSWSEYSIRCAELFATL